MKYKIYCNNKEYKVPSATVYGYGDVIKAPWHEDVAIKLWDGDTLYIRTDDEDDGGSNYVIYTSLESGNAHGVFYISQDGSITQSSYNWVCSGEVLQNYGDYIRIYKFGDYEDIYDTEIGDNAGSEWDCRTHGSLVIILKFDRDAQGNNVWRLIDPSIAKYNGQWIDLLTMNERLFISSYARTRYGENGFYYIFESGNEGLGLLVDRSDTSVYCESFCGWFGNCSPNEDFDLYVYHCGEGFYETDLYGSIQDYYDWDEVNNFFLSQNIQPTILRYNADTELWYLVQEGTRYDY